MTARWGHDLLLRSEYRARFSMKFQSGSARQGASVCSRRCVVLGQPSKNVAQGWQRQLLGRRRWRRHEPASAPPQTLPPPGHQAQEDHRQQLINSAWNLRFFCFCDQSRAAAQLVRLYGQVASPRPGLRFCTYRGSVSVSGAVSVSVSAALCVSAVAVWELIKGLQSAGQLLNWATQPAASPHQLAKSSH